MFAKPPGNRPPPILTRSWTTYPQPKPSNSNSSNNHRQQWNNSPDGNGFISTMKHRTLVHSRPKNWWNFMRRKALPTKHTVRDWARQLHVVIFLVLTLFLPQRVVLYLFFFQSGPKNPKLGKPLLFPTPSELFYKQE